MILHQSAVGQQKVQPIGIYHVQIISGGRFVFIDQRLRKQESIGIAGTISFGRIAELHVLNGSSALWNRSSILLREECVIGHLYSFSFGTAGLDEDHSIGSTSSINGGRRSVF